jgi:hypothetical protein
MEEVRVDSSVSRDGSEVGSGDRADRSKHASLLG